MTNLPKTPGEAYEAGLREGDRRTAERIAEKLGKVYCLSGVIGERCPTKTKCAVHWLQYLTEDSQ